MMAEGLQEWQQRTQLFVGDEGMSSMQSAHILVVGLGGVGAYAAEMLCRAGIGEMTLIDADVIQPTNINRQLPALHSTVGLSKVEVLAERFKDINPQIKLNVRQEFVDGESIPELLRSNKFDFIVDAIDTIAPKCELIYHALRQKIRIISSMGAGAKGDMTQIRLADLWDTYHCGLSKAVRSRLKKMGMKHRLPVVFCSEQVKPEAIVMVENERNKKTTTGTISYMPAIFGCYLAGYVIRELTRKIS